MVHIRKRMHFQLKIVYSHNSAGVGRTGTYLALDIIMDQAQHEKEVNIYCTVRRMRDERCTMVQNKVNTALIIFKN